MAGGTARLRVPVGEDADRWITRTGCRRVLFVVHNVTSATRLLDVLPLFHSDVRVQMFATCTGSSPFLAGVPELLARAGLPVLPWEQAKDTEFDLVVSASYGGELGSLRGKLTVLSHGTGYNKRLAAPDSPVSRTTEPPVFGLAPDWLLEDGRPLATATVLSHPEQLDRIRSACPEAAPTAVLAGDPCYDRILAALPQRDRFRRALGVGPGQRLIVVSSTWASRSLFGGGRSGGADEPGADERGAEEPGAADLLPWLLSRLAAELPADEYRTAAVLHPNIWYGHGPGQVQAWLDSARRAGLEAIPPLDGWRQALIAADCVLGDHSSVTYYAASIGVPVVLGAFPQEDLDPRSPVAALGRTAPRLLRRGSLRAQIDRAIDAHHPDRYKALAEQTSSSPGESAVLLRRLFYDLMGIPEPEAHPALLDPLPLPPYTPTRVTAPIRVLVRQLSADPPELAVTRYAVVGDAPDADPARDPGAPVGTADTAHTAADEETRETGRLSVADVVVRRAAEDDARLGPPAAWASEALGRYPYCGLVAYVDGPDRCVVRTREGDLVRLSAAADPDGRPDLCDPAVYASALHAWLTDGHTLDAALPAITVRTGTAAHHVTVEPLPQPPPTPPPAGSHASDSASSTRSRSAPTRSPLSS
ncbi:hypothetical protein IW294_22245 [Streptomyces olivaceus]|uniref:hypothetical protein n=1 Tax=Streptomyces olivaceus TaxID=47716 RepID=UPI0018A7EA22|nr:hypothetical protein [Streptomyces olivaceus]MBF8173471.1 hypothetical protein [Streptomyces olivaceus]